MIPLGRVVFPGNPWPRGHAIEAFAWTGRLTSEGVWFDFHLETVGYASEHSALPRDEKDTDKDSWRSAIVWQNYHSCTLSSTNWGEHNGILVGTAKAPLNFAQLSGQTFVADQAAQGDKHECDRHQAFGIYLTGHDGVADHHLKLTHTGPGKWDIDWKGRIALVYEGDDELKHTFEATIRGVGFGGFQIPDDMDDDEALAVFKRAVIDHDSFQIQKQDGGRVLAMKES